MGGRRRTPAAGVAVAASWLIAFATIAGCSERAAVRVYDEVVVAPSPVESLFAGSASTTESPYEWSIPTGWQEFAGDTIRLATFEVAADGATAETTIVSLAGGAGGPRANVVRWLDQLGVALNDEQLDQLMAEAPKVTTIEGPSLAVYDLTPFSAPGAESTIGALGAMRTETVFIKMTGPIHLLRQQRGAFEGLVGSLRAR